MLDEISLLGVKLTNATEKEVLEYIIKNIESSSEKYYIVTPNPEMLVYASNNTSFKDILNNAKLALIDGVGIIWAGKVLGKNIKQRITGTDLMESLCKEVSASNEGALKKPITVGFLGGRQKVAERTAECLQKKYPGLKVIFADQEPDKLLKEPKLLIDILFVAFGFPKQEKWIAENLEKIPVKVAMGVGGAFDYISGSVPRAPVFIRMLGFEWLYRLIRQPWRWKRQLVLIEFALMILREKIENRK